MIENTKIKFLQSVGICNMSKCHNHISMSASAHYTVHKWRNRSMNPTPDTSYLHNALKEIRCTIAINYPMCNTNTHLRFLFIYKIKKKKILNTTSLIWRFHVLIEIELYSAMTSPEQAVHFPYNTTSDKVKTGRRLPLGAFSLPTACQHHATFPNRVI